MLFLRSDIYLKLISSEKNTNRKFLSTIKSKEKEMAFKLFLQSKQQKY